MAIARFAASCPPLVCTAGWPSGAAIMLLRRLAASGAHLRYHGDFDGGGLRIAAHVMARTGAEPWRMATADYLAAVSPQETGSPMPAVIDGPASIPAVGPVTAARPGPARSARPLGTPTSRPPCAPATSPFPRNESRPFCWPTSSPSDLPRHTYICIQMAGLPRCRISRPSRSGIDRLIDRKVDREMPTKPRLLTFHREGVLGKDPHELDHMLRGNVVDGISLEQHPRTSGLRQIPDRQEAVIGPVDLDVHQVRARTGKIPRDGDVHRNRFPQIYHYLRISHHHSPQKKSRWR